MWKRLFGRSDEPKSKGNSEEERLDWLFPYPVRIVPGVHAVSVLTDMRSRATDALPLLIGGEEHVEQLAETFEIDDGSPAEYIQASGNVEPVAWLEQRVANDPECYEETIGEWPAQVQRHPHPIGFLDLKTNRPPRRVAIAEIPTMNSWEIPAYLRFGNWNDCPPPEAHVAICKRWHELYGAELVAAQADILEFHVARPPRDRDAAMQLAREQYHYCSDIVDQGLGDLSTLAATIMGGAYWYFWWD